MEKKRLAPVLIGAFVLVFFVMNFFFFSKRSSAPATGAVIGSSLPLGLNITLLAFILQWVILLVIVIFGYSRFLKHRKEEDEKIKNFVIPQLKSNAETMFDVFYKLLKEKKSLSISTVAKAFKIKKEQALEWGKILEEHNLVYIEYPTFSDPEIKIETEKKDVESLDEVKK